MRVLVVGAEQFIGRRVTWALANSRWAAPVAGVCKGAIAERENLRQIRIDPGSRASMAAALQGIDAVVNCLGTSPRAIAAGAEALFGAAAAMRPAPLIVHLGSMSVYGSLEGEVTEESPLRADLGPYAGAQRRSEALAANYARSVIFRPGCEYGPEGELWSGRIARMLTARRIGDLGPAGDGYCNLVHVDDIATAVLGCLQQPPPAGRVFNLAMPDPPTWNEYFVQFARALQAVPVQRISRRRLAWETRVLAAPLKAAALALQACGLRGDRLPPPIPPSLLRLAAQEIRLDSGRARRELAWTARPLDQGLADTAAWFRAADRAGDRGGQAASGR
jgi:2-alkyl-3-oxoalkanoate reductase